MCAGLCPIYLTFGNAEKNINGSCPQHEWDHPPFLEFFTPPPRLQGADGPQRGKGHVGRHCPYTNNFGVNPSTRCWDIAQKPPKSTNSPLTPIVTKISFFPYSPHGAANLQKGRRHIRNQNTPACKCWRESARGLSRNRWQKSEQKNIQ